ncbi:MAG: hypothetical protein ACLQGU_23010 [bacterium]
MTKVFIGIMGLLLISLLLRLNNFSRENNMVQLAIETVRLQADLPEDVEVKFVEKRESSIPDFYAVKLLVIKADQKVPMVVYVDRAADKVIVGSLFVRGENITRREAADSGIPKIDVGYLETGKTSLTY